MADEVEEIMARALWEDWRTCKTATEAARDTSWEMILEGAASRPKIADIRDDGYSQARAAIAALHAHGYEIKKRDPDMMVIKEIETKYTVES